MTVVAVKETRGYQSGQSRVRTMMVEIAWLWLRYQPNSKLSRWFRERFAGGGARMRRVGIVALARRLLVALWRYLEEGMLPEGADSRPPVRSERLRRGKSAARIGDVQICK